MKGAIILHDILSQYVATAPRSQRVLALWVAVVNASGAASALLLPRCVIVIVISSSSSVVIIC
jgi:hypothetical protein